MIVAQLLAPHPRGYQVGPLFTFIQYCENLFTGGLSLRSSRRVIGSCSSACFTEGTPSAILEYHGEGAESWRTTSGQIRRRCGTSGSGRRSQFTANSPTIICARKLSA